MNIVGMYVRQSLFRVYIYVRVYIYMIAHKRWIVASNSFFFEYIVAVIDDVFFFLFFFVFYCCFFSLSSFLRFVCRCIFAPCLRALALISFVMYGLLRNFYSLDAKNWILKMRKLKLFEIIWWKYLQLFFSFCERIHGPNRKPILIIEFSVHRTWNHNLNNLSFVVHDARAAVSQLYNASFIFMQIYQLNMIT